MNYSALVILRHHLVLPVLKHFPAVSMPAKYTLYYFSGKGRGETIRQMFALGGVDYEDIRYEKPEWEESIKKSKTLSLFVASFLNCVSRPF